MLMLFGCRDLKAANSFIGEDGSVKIGDMNVSKKLNQGNLKTQIGTPYYMAPEIWEHRPYNSSCDIWSLGCMVYELCCLRPPFEANDLPRLKRAIVAGRYPSIPNRYHQDLGTVIAAMLKVNPANRSSAAALLKSPAVASRLHLDGSDPGTARSEKDPGLLKTIHAPRQMVHLSSALPKPCYPDTRPNSPGAWTVEEQTTRRRQLEREAEEKEERVRRMAIPDTVEEDEVSEVLDRHSRRDPPPPQQQDRHADRQRSAAQGQGPAQGAGAGGKQVWFRENTRDEHARRQRERVEKEKQPQQRERQQQQHQADEDIRNHQRHINPQQPQQGHRNHRQEAQKREQQPSSRVHAVVSGEEDARKKQKYILQYKQKKAMQDFQSQHHGRSPAEEREAIRAKQQRGHNCFLPAI
jgi:NIMA (never in mitosis gene a)-related kinase 1/4/5